MPRLPYLRPMLLGFTAGVALYHMLQTVLWSHPPPETATESKATSSPSHPGEDEDEGSKKKKQKTKKKKKTEKKQKKKPTKSSTRDRDAPGTGGGDDATPATATTVTESTNKNKKKNSRNRDASSSSSASASSARKGDELLPDATEASEATEVEPPVVFDFDFAGVTWECAHDGSILICFPEEEPSFKDHIQASPNATIRPSIGDHDDDNDNDDDNGQPLGEVVPPKDPSDGDGDSENETKHENETPNVQHQTNEPTNQPDGFGGTGNEEEDDSKLVESSAAESLHANDPHGQAYNSLLQRLSELEEDALPNPPLSVSNEWILPSAAGGGTTES